MKVVIRPVGRVPPRILQGLGALLPSPFSRFSVCPDPLDPAPFFDPARRQLDAVALLDALAPPPAGRLGLWVSATDLFVPALAHVVGLAPLAEGKALVSWARLAPADPQAWSDRRGQIYGRLQLEAAHELGHAVGLTHCPVPRCPMHPALSPEELDERDPAYCPACKETLDEALGLPKSQ